jgi:type IV secretion system protein VirB11
VRGAEALDLLKAWNTGHPGGIATLHANSALGGLHRLEQLIGEASSHIPRRLIAETIDLIVFIARRNGTRRIKTISEVTGFDGEYLMKNSKPRRSNLIVFPTLQPETGDQS